MPLKIFQLNSKPAKTRKSWRAKSNLPTMNVPQIGSALRSKLYVLAGTYSMRIGPQGVKDWAHRKEPRQWSTTIRPLLPQGVEDAGFTSGASSTGERVSSFTRKTPSSSASGRTGRTKCIQGKSLWVHTPFTTLHNYVEEM
jgi:hypothetical protein